MVGAVRARQYGKDALQELALLGVVAQTAGDEATWAALVLPAKRGRDDDDAAGDSLPKRARGAGASAT